MANVPLQSSSARTISSTSETGYKLPPSEPRLPSWHRFLVGTACLSLGLLVVGTGVASIFYRSTHLGVNNGLINGRTVRIQAPVDGTIQDFYARPGVRVQTGQVLAYIEPLPGAEDTSPLAQLPPINQIIPTQITSAQQALDLLNQQLQELERQYQALQTTTVTIATEGMNHANAAVDAASAQEAAARSEYERFRSLLQAGAVSQQEVDELQAAWQSAQAVMQQAQSDQRVAQVEAEAIEQQTPIQSSIKDLQSRRRQLLQDIQTQTAHINILESELQSQQNPLPQHPWVTSDAASIVPIAAPFDGVVYSTQQDAGEQVNRPTTLLSVLDCRDLWVEALVSTEQAKRIDAGQPVRVQLANDRETVIGEVEFLNAVSASNLAEARAEALLPAVPANLVGQSLARVRVRIPSTPIQDQAHQFCGVGQSARLTFGTHSLTPAWLSGFLNL
ncbi:MAG: HlyD family efflux transporter periplasmic adaptor subunit [Leptolyngbya sp. SIO1E4]|nr:HlyD family efflux transporter periplasmic adaptor subunit [Leptolyngbya sp. SIO1E4]